MKPRQTSVAYRGAIVASTLFFAGIVASAYLLFMAYKDFSIENLQVACIVVGATFLLGTTALYLLTSHKEIKVVYMEKQSANIQHEEIVVADAASQLDVQPIAKIVDSPHNALQSALNEICNQLQAGQGAIYIAKDQLLELKYGYALTLDRQASIQYEMGEGLVGRVAELKEMLYLDKLPENYITVYSGLGAASPSYLVIAPIIKGTQVEGVLEISTFQPLNEPTLNKLKEVTEILTSTIHKENMIAYA
jgi:hypothetical protein